MITYYLFGRIIIICAHFLRTPRQEFLLHGLIRCLLVQLELQGLRVQLLMGWLLVELLIKLFCVNGERHGSNILIHNIVIFRITRILQVRRIFFLLVVLGLATTPVFDLLVAEAECVPVRVPVIAAHHCLALLHIWTGGELHIVDAIADALLLVDLSIRLISVGW